MDVGRRMLEDGRPKTGDRNTKYDVRGTRLEVGCWMWEVRSNPVNLARDKEFSIQSALGGSLELTNNKRKT